MKTILISFATVFALTAACQKKSEFKPFKYHIICEHIELDSSLLEYRCRFNLPFDEGILLYSDLERTSKNPNSMCSYPIERKQLDSCRLGTRVSYKGLIISNFSAVYDFNTKKFNKNDITKDHLGNVNIGEDEEKLAFFDEKSQIGILLFSSLSAPDMYDYAFIFSTDEKNPQLYVVEALLLSEYFETENNPNNKYRSYELLLEDCQNRWFRLAEQLCKSKN